MGAVVVEAGTGRGSVLIPEAIEDRKVIPSGQQLAAGPTRERYARWPVGEFAEAQARANSWT
ncbi:hypothetical protein [Mycolicibacterium fortuitum]|uniref:hypothetical protein n=1 Tax=Mycolicibacterium fortuitum TaxID=1766 RepID=UPI0010427572|nr:hypothetical protein [Mycolicibacterium fortuitum]NOQ62525.1 hypothetical protein [Mycolicibacterium fortuitum]